MNADSPRLQVIAVDDPVLQELFDPCLPNNPALWAVLKGRHAGKAVVDNLQTPSQCVLRTEAALTYFGKQTGQAFLNEAVAYFKEMASVWLVWPRHTSIHPPESSFYVIGECIFHQYQ